MLNAKVIQILYKAENIDFQLKRNFMGRIFLLALLTSISFGCWGQPPVTSLNENFDVDCVLSTDFPSGWLKFNPVPGTSTLGSWVCSPTDGRVMSGIPTPGIECTGTYSSAYHIDTSFLLTPNLDLSGFTGHVYLQFDTKATNVHLGSSLAVEHVLDSANPDTSTTTDITSGMTPIFSNGDSSGWVTHVVDLTAYKTSPFYVGFRYCSPATTGSIWYLDNVLITSTPVTLSVPAVAATSLGLIINGISSGSSISFSIDVAQAGAYQLAVTDLTGRVVYQETRQFSPGRSMQTINGLDLHPGLFFLRIRNAFASGDAKVIVQ